MVTSSSFSEIVCYINTALAWAGNGVLIILILKKSPKTMANYKYLMLVFSSFGIIFGIIDITNQPMLHFYKGAYIVFSKNPFQLPRKISFWYLALNCSCYGMTLSLLAFHFVYRYIAVCRPHLLFIFSFPYFNIFVFIFVFVSLEWWISAIIFAGENEFVSNYIETTMLDTFGLERLDYTYASSVFYRNVSDNGMEHLSLPDLRFVLNIAIIIISGFSVIIFCWLKLRSELIKSARQIHVYSQRTLEMQKQLFRALVAQTLFPVFFMFIPAGALLGFPIFKIEPGPIEVAILALITTQPFVDSIVPMYFIKEYRNSMLELLGMKRSRSQILRVSSHIEDRSTRIVSSKV